MMSRDDVKEIQEYKEWVVSSDDNKNKYKVIANQQNCPDNHCRVRCEQCKICIHEFQCSCPDSLIMSTICKHIHLVKHFMKENTADEMMEVTCDNKLEEMPFLVKCVQTKDNNVENTKKRIKNTLLQLMEQLDNSNSPSALKHLDKQLSAAKNSFISLLKAGNQEAIELTESNKHAPANKNMEPQRRFFTTKKRTKKQMSASQSHQLRSKKRYL